MAACVRFWQVLAANDRYHPAFLRVRFGSFSGRLRKTGAFSEGLSKKTRRSIEEIL
ncbi:hypothetical protein [Chryseobacterium gregarium]|uniref:hypothetical protein n=1 Tax=Chryseobacterium gregarium TaxID=456299 RepID=UPI0012DEBC92|nr:hypothetical protein [Chryseobacterium gregarium]